MKNIKPEAVKSLNEIFKVNYSEERYSILEDLGIISLITVDTNSEEDLADIYMNKFYNMILFKEVILEELEKSRGMSVNEFIISLGRKRCLYTYEGENIVVNVLKQYIFNNNNVIEIGEDDKLNKAYVFDGGSLKLGEDIKSGYRFERCFHIEDNASFEYEILRLAALLNLDENRLKVENMDSYYIVLLDGEELGIWSKELMKEYQEEAIEFKNFETHSPAFCDECINEEYCKYADVTNAYSKRLLSDKLRLPIFSISTLTRKLDRYIY